MLEFDFTELGKRIRAEYVSKTKFAEAMGFHVQSLDRKLAGTSPWKDYEILKAINLLGLSVDDVGKYFFTPKTS